MERRQTAIAGCTSTGILKILALVFMCCDHAGKMIFPNVPEMRMIGRLAFPLYCWCLVVGFNYTRSVPKYMLRLLLIGLVSQPLYMLALNHPWSHPNIFLTLLLGLAAMWGIREKRCGSQLWAPALALVLAVCLGCDYGWKGVTLMLLLYAARESRGAIAAVMVAFCLYWGSSSTTVSSIFGISLLNALKSPVTGGMLPGFLRAALSALKDALYQLVQPFMRLQGMAILALPLMLIPLPRVKLPRWLGYALYPLHLLLLLLAQWIMSPDAMVARFHGYFF